MTDEQKVTEAVDPGSSAPPVLIDADPNAAPDPVLQDHALGEDSCEQAMKTSSLDDWDGVRHAALDHAKVMWTQLSSKAEHDLHRMVDEVLTIARKVEAYLRGR